MPAREHLLAGGLFRGVGGEGDWNEILRYYTPQNDKVGATQNDIGKE